MCTRAGGVAASRAVKVKAVCTDGREVSTISVEDRHGRPYIYGLYYDPQEQRTKRCYIGPADPEEVIHSMPVALLVKPDAWLPALRQSLLSLAQNVLAYRPDLAPELARALSDALAALGVGREGQGEREREATAA